MYDISTIIIEAMDVDEDELAMGIEVEAEHTKDLKMRKKIAMDHLKEDPKYYTKLKNAGIRGESIDTILESVIGYKAHTTFKSIPPLGINRPILVDVLFSRNTRMNEKPFRVTLFSRDKILTHIELSHIPLIEELNDCDYQQRIFKWIKTADDCVEFKLGVWGF